MNPVMWNNIATQDNYQKLLSRGMNFIEPENGDMACGESGTGRLAEPKLIFNTLLSYLNKKMHFANNHLQGISIIVTAGPTLESIDPVRFISNKSSGKQGYAIASELTKRGALVTLITGPVKIPFPNVNKIIHIESAQEMFNKTMSELPVDVIICAAAVGDWKIINVSDSLSQTPPRKKIKKSKKPLMFKAIQNPDILASVAHSNKRPRLVVGFAAETENIISYAKEKKETKNIDLIIANDVSNDKDIGKNNNKVFVIDKNNCEEWDEQDKSAIAFKLADKIDNILSN